MATPTAPSKRYYAAGLVQASAWGTATAVGAGNEILVNSDGNPALKQTYSSTDAIDQVMAKDGDLGVYEAIDFAPTFEGKTGLQYAPGPLGSAIAALFGASASPAKLVDAAYKHVWTWADEETDFFTFVTERPGAIWEIPSCIVTKLNLKVGDGKVQGSIGFRGNYLTNSSAINTYTQVDALTPETTANFVKFQDGACWMAAQTHDDALMAEDAIVVSDMDITYERVMDAQISMGATYLAQPHESSFKVTVKLTLPYATATNVGYLTTFTAMTAQQMLIKFTGGVASSTDHYSLGLYFPRLKLVSPPDVKLEDIIKNGLEFTAEEAASAPTGMNSTRPYIELVNLRTTNYLT